MFSRRICSFARLLVSLFLCVSFASFASAAEANEKCNSEKQKETIDRAIRSHGYVNTNENEYARVISLARKEQHSMYAFESRCGCASEEDIRKDLGMNETGRGALDEEETESSDKERHFACHEFLGKYGNYVAWRNRVLSDDAK